MMYRWLYCVLSKVGSLEGEKRPSTWNPPFCAGPFTEEGQSVCVYISASLTFPKSFLPHKCGTYHLTLSLGSLLKAMVVSVHVSDHCADSFMSVYLIGFRIHILMVVEWKKFRTLHGERLSETGAWPRQLLEQTFGPGIVYKRSWKPFTISPLGVNPLPIFEMVTLLMRQN